MTSFSIALRPLAYLAVRSTLAATLTASAVLLCGTANASPLVDGHASSGEYSNSLSVHWYNNHNTAGTQFPESGPQTTMVYYDWESASSQLYLYLEAPIAAKNMIWGAGWTEDEARLYYQHWCSPNDGNPAADDGSNCSHHKDGFSKFLNDKGDFGTMTGSEKTIFAGITADLAGDIKDDGGYNIAQYMDSVDYVIANLGCDTTDCAAYDTPMSFEFLFSDFASIGEVDAFLGQISSTGIVFHLSPERGGPEPASLLESAAILDAPAVSEPATLALFSVGLIGLGAVSRSGQLVRFLPRRCIPQGRVTMLRLCSRLLSVFVSRHPADLGQAPGGNRG